MEAHPATAATIPTSGGRGRVRLPGLGVGLGTGTVMLYLSVIVLLPLAAVVSEAFSGGLGTFWDQVTSPLAKSALELTVICSLIVVVINAIFGTILAWILVRDEFPGKSLVNAVIDLPFALPTIVASLTLLALYGQRQPNRDPHRADPHRGRRRADVRHPALRRPRRAAAAARDGP